MNLMQASKQHAMRPADERMVNLHALDVAANFRRVNSTRKPMANRQITVVPNGGDDMFGVHAEFKTDKGEGRADFTHWSFGQIAALGNAPASYLRSLPAPLAADCANYGLHVARDVEDVSVNIFAPKDSDGVRHYQLRSINGPNYGTIWDAEISRALVDNFGDGMQKGTFRIPGAFGAEYTGNASESTVFTGDRSLHVFLADEDRRITIPNRRDGRSGTLARGFWIENSEVGFAPVKRGAFLFDHMCCNHIIWNVSQFSEVSFKHTSGAPFRWREEIKPLLTQLADGPVTDITTAIANSQKVQLKDKMESFLATRFGSKTIGPQIEAAHLLDEGRPMETLWDVVVGSTAFARQLEHVDARMKVERIAGDLLAKAL